MSDPCTLPLFDASVHPSSWNERMAAGEYAVHYSSFDGSSGATSFCNVFSSLPEAEDYAKEQVALRPGLRCRIYDHRGFVGAPIREIKGNSYKGEREITPRFRRWVGSILLFGGLALMVLDWYEDFKLSWPAMIGTRMLAPGVILLLTETVLLYTSRKAAHDGEKGTG